MHARNIAIDQGAKVIVEWGTVSILVTAILAHIVSPAIEISIEFSFGYEKGNAMCIAMMMGIMFVSGAMAIRMHQREFYIYSHLLSWMIPSMIFVMSTDVRSSRHDYAAITLMLLGLVLGSVFILRSDFSRIMPYKVILTAIILLTGIVSFGVMEKLLVAECCASLWFVNKYCL